MWKIVTSATALAALCLGFTAGTAAAGQKYDKKIEQAVIAIVSSKMGQIRGAHALDEPHVLFPPVEARSVKQGTLDSTPYDRPAPRVSSFQAILTAFE
ncbi:MAG: hypothetical protein NXI27_22800 [Alphaproteobacteria bacterium]|nr:hypothetical protein [Alphaproteobacteria bacterium]